MKLNLKTHQFKHLLKIMNHPI